MRILVTGGLGFIGAHLVDALLKQSHEVTIIDNLYHNQNPSDFSFIQKLKFIQGDIKDSDLIEQICKDKDIIFHLAALSSIRESTENSEYCLSTNILGTFNILKAAAKNNIKKIIFSSSREVYGNAEFFPVKENSPLKPFNIYGITKVCDEHLCNFFRENHELNITIFRIANAYGQNDPGKSRVIPTFLRKIKNNQDLELNGGDQILDFVWIDDVIKILLESIDKYDNKVFNVGSGKGTSIKQLAELMISLSKKDLNIKVNPRVPQEIDKYIADISKLNMQPTSLEQGLKFLLQA